MRWVVHECITQQLHGKSTSYYMWWSSTVYWSQYRSETMRWKYFRSLSNIYKKTSLTRWVYYSENTRQKASFCSSSMPFSDYNWSRTCGKILFSFHFRYRRKPPFSFRDGQFKSNISRPRLIREPFIQLNQYCNIQCPQLKFKKVQLRCWRCYRKAASIRAH